MAEKNKILVVGSIAYDNVMQFDGYFKDIMVPGHYSCAVTASNRVVSYGGCGANISYNLKVLGESPILLTVAGNDFTQYKEWFTSVGIDTSAIYLSEKFLTASAFICTDKEDNQITLFDGGAMSALATTQGVKSLNYSDIAYTIIAPDNPDRMIRVARECKELEIPFVFDPAQEISFIKNQDLVWAVNNCNVLIVNDYEADLLAKVLHTDKTRLGAMVPVYIETHGAKGSTIMSRKEGTFYIRSVQPSKMVDPTGCGDAFRAGVLMGLKRNLPIQKAGQAGALLAAYNLENPGTQTHKFTMDEFNKRFEDNFGETLF